MLYRKCFIGNALWKGFRGKGLEEMVTGIEQRMLVVPDTKVKKYAVPIMAEKIEYKRNGSLKRCRIGGGCKEC